MRLCALDILVDVGANDLDPATIAPCLLKPSAGHGSHGLDVAGTTASCRSLFILSQLGTKEHEATLEHEDYRGQWVVTPSNKNRVPCRQ